MNFNDLFNLKLSSEEEAQLATYTGCYIEHYDENGLVGTEDTREPVLEVLKRRKELKLIMNDIYLKYFPINKQIGLLSKSLSPDEMTLYSQRAQELTYLYEKYKALVIAETNMDTMYNHMADIKTEADNLFLNQ